MNIIIFGTGLFYENRKHKIPYNINIIAFLDNNKRLWGKRIGNIEIVSPECVNNYDFDKIVLMSKKSDEMKEQLLYLNVNPENIMGWNDFFKFFQRGRFQFFCGNESHGSRERILILSTPLGYTGGPLTAVYAAMALQLKDYDVVLCASEGNQQFIDEIVKFGINVVLCPAVSFLGREELFWIQQFDVVLVNTFLMVLAACEISSYKPIVWWIHECSSKFENYYSDTINTFKRYTDRINEFKINILGVSAIARENFNEFFPNKIKRTLIYGIPDEKCLGVESLKKEKKLVFAVIGTICKRKGQKIFLEAIRLLGNKDREKAEFWIIGKSVDKKYADYVECISMKYSCVKVKGEYSRHEMKDAYRQIDVIVCPSLEETMSIVLTEGMMNGKVCITTNRTGMADYVVHGENGFICEAGDTVSLCSCIKWIIENWNDCDKIKKEARNTYEQYFTLGQFADRLEKVIFQTKECY